MALKGGSGENNIGSKVFFLFFGRGGGGVTNEILQVL